MALIEARDSCSYPNRVWKFEYDVFLSFRGEDTRFGFTGHLYDALIRAGVKAFIDDECLRRGVEISPDLVKAIDGSREYIIVFSENYASSSWCLDELVKILDCMELRGQLVLPVFYKIDPSMVRKQTGPYEKAMAEYENQQSNNNDKVAQWRSALRQAANLSGWHIEFGYEFQFIQSIVENVCSRINRQPLHVTAYPVGLESRTSQVISRLGLHELNDDVRMVGIYGMGGIGKSTLARAVYNSIAYQFHGASFLSEVREKASQRGGLAALQEKLLFDLLGVKNKMELGDVCKGISVIRQRLCDKKILLILDDANKLEQLEALAGMPDWFGHGSRILITTRDKHLLTAHNVSSIYEVDLLNEVQAMELFSWHAFGRRQPDPTYQDISKRVVNYAECLPLALEVIGRAFKGRRLEDCEDALDKYRSIPEGDIISKLKISYDDLDDFERKIFLDIACFFKGEDYEYVRRILEASDLNPTIGLKKLIERGLLTKSYHTVQMHCLIQEMGREIVRRESPSNVGERSRLWRQDDIIQVLADDIGTNAVEGIMLDVPRESELEEIEWNGEGFKKMKNLRILIIRNACFSTAPTYLPNSLRVLHWENYPSSFFLPPSFHPRKLVVLKVPHSHLTLTEKPFKRLEALTQMDFSFCYFITKVPDLSGVPNLEVLKLFRCLNLVEVHDSVGSLGKLVELNASGCCELTTLPQALKLRKLKTLYLVGCPKLRRFPDIQEPMENLKDLNLDGSGIEALPSSIKYMTTLTFFHLYNCKRLEFVPHTIAQMQSLHFLNFNYCPLIGNALSSWVESTEEDCSTSSSSLSLSLKSFDLNVCSNISCLFLEGCNLLDEHLVLIPKLFPLLQLLSLSKNPFEVIPECFRAFQHLVLLDLDECRKLQEFPNILPDMPKLTTISTKNCVVLSPQSWDFFLKEMVKKYYYRSYPFQLGHFSSLGPISYLSAHRQFDFIPLPGCRIPEWFHHRSEGKSISFYARGNYFPHFLLCICFDVNNDKQRFKFIHNFFENLDYWSDPLRNCEFHVTENWDTADWNHVEVCLYFKSTSKSLAIKQYGIHFNEETCMEDIRFSYPSVWGSHDLVRKEVLLPRTLSLFSLISNSYTLRTFYHV